jgi:hypothetical protein
MFRPASTRATGNKTVSRYLATGVLFPTALGGKVSMKSRQMPLLAVFAISITSSAWSQERPLDCQNVPIYSVTVTERTVKAVNYEYRSDLQKSTSEAPCFYLKPRAMR